MISIDQALSHLLRDVKVVEEAETVDLIDAHHRVLATPQQATINVPPANVSAMDGYAIHSAQTKIDTPYSISQRIAAGHPAKPLAAGTVARLFTGSEIPQGADTVVIQEDCQTDNDKVVFKVLPKQGANVRLQGQDILAGATLFSAGRKLLPQDLGLLASVGIQSVSCKRRLRIGVLSTGDELIEPGQTPAPGKIFNSNRFTLRGLINSVDMEFVYLGHIEDDADTTRHALKDGAERVDVLITTGGVSVGEEDHLKAAVESLGELSLWKLAIKPGKPLAYGRITTKNQQSTPLFGLPGNPVAVFVTFLVVVRPYLLAMQGDTASPPQPQLLQSGFTVTKASPRQEYRRVKIEGDKVQDFHTQDSGVLSSTHWADALAVVPADATITTGDNIAVYPFSLFNL